MTVQNEVKWLLDIIKSNYPTAWPDDLVLRNRDDHVTRYDSGDVKEKGVSIDRWNVVGVSTGSVNRELFGSKPQYDVVTTLDVRMEGKSSDDWGETTDDDEWKTLVAYVQNAINSDIRHPAVDTGDEDIGRVQYFELSITDENHQSVENLDNYLTTFTVTMIGYQDTP